MDYIKKLTAVLVEKILSKGVRDMPQNPASQGYDERQIRGFYYIPEKEILNVIMEIEDDVKKVLDDINKNKVSITDVVDSLDSEKTDKPLSAKQGKILNEKIKKQDLNIKNINKLTYKVVNELPETGENNVIYFVPNTQSTDKNIKDECMWINNAWELIGSTAVDLSDVINDVQINGTSNVENGVANIPVADKDNFGVSKISNAGDYGIQIITDGTVQTKYASESEIALRNLRRSVIGPFTIDYATMVALTDPKNHTWTDEEKESARETLGAVSNPKIGNSLLYFDNAYKPGAILVNGASEQAQSFRIPRYASGGALSVGTPTQPFQATPKSYVDDLIANAGGTQLYKHHISSQIGVSRYIVDIVSPRSTEYNFSTLVEDINNYPGFTRIYYQEDIDGYWVTRGVYFMFDEQMMYGVNTSTGALEIGYIMIFEEMEESAPIPLQGE